MFLQIERWILPSSESKLGDSLDSEVDVIRRCQREPGSGCCILDLWGPMPGYDFFGNVKECFKRGRYPESGHAALVTEVSVHVSLNLFDRFRGCRALGHIRHSAHFNWYPA